MNRNKILTKTKKNWTAPLAITMTAVLGVTPVLSTPVYATNSAVVSSSESSVTGTSSDSDSAVTKDETVYVVADSSGKSKDITVSDQLKGAGNESTISDVSDLTEIQNTKGGEIYTGSGDNMTWSTDGEDIYYQGKTDKELPVGVTFTYYLDGEKIEPKDLVGKSGKLTIDIEYENNTETTMTVDGKDQTTKIPFVMMTAMFMPSENFSNITIDNGKIIDDGSKSIVVGFGMPGLSDVLDVDRLKSDDDSDSLDIDNITDKVDNKSIPESVEIKADVTDFELDSTYTIASNDIFNEIDFSDVSSLSDLTDKVDEIEDATLQLVDGSKELADGTKTLRENYVTMDKGIADLQTGIKSYTDGVVTAANGSYDVSIGATSLRDGLGTISGNSAALDKGASDLADGVKSYTGGTEQIKAGINASVSALSKSPVQAAQDYLKSNGDKVAKLSRYSTLLSNTTATTKVLQDIQTAQQSPASGGQSVSTKQGGSFSDCDEEENSDDTTTNYVSNTLSTTPKDDNDDTVKMTVETTNSAAPDENIETTGENTDSDASQNSVVDKNSTEEDSTPDIGVQTKGITGNVLMDNNNNAGIADASQNTQMAQMITQIVANDYGLTDPTEISEMTQIISAGLTAYQSSTETDAQKKMQAFSTGAISKLYEVAGFTDPATAQATIQQVAIATALVGADLGLSSLISNDSSLISGANTLSDGVKQYTAGVDTAYSGSQTLADGAASLYYGMMTLVSKMTA